MNKIFEKVTAEFDRLPMHTIICDNNHRVVWCARHANEHCPIPFAIGDCLDQVLNIEQPLLANYQKDLQQTPLVQTSICCFEMEFQVQVTSFVADHTYYIWHLLRQFPQGELKLNQSAWLEIGAQYRTAIFHIYNTLSPLTEALDQAGLLKSMQYLDYISENCQSLLKTTLNLNEYLKLSSDSATYCPKLVDLKQVLDDLVSQANYLLKRVNKSVTVQTTGTQFYVRIDHDKFLLCMLNLLANALENTVEGSVLKLHLVELDNNISLLLRDDGNGMPDDVKGRAFDAFFSQKADLEMPKGLGLGLYLVKEFVHAHGGFVLLNSACYEGTSITLQFPKQECDEQIIFRSQSTDQWLLDKLSPLYAFLGEYCIPQ